MVKAVEREVAEERRCFPNSYLPMTLAELWKQMDKSDRTGTYRPYVGPSMVQESKDSASDCPDLEGDFDEPYLDEHVDEPYLSDACSDA